MSTTRKLILFLIFLITIFLINILFYFISDDYNFFIRKLKTSDVIIESQNIKISDELNNNNFEKEEIKKKSSIIVIQKKESEITNEVVLGKTYNDILKIFNIFNLKKLEINSNLFDITEEYPDEYYEYYGKDLTLYFFHTKSYYEVKDIFYYLESELPFKINEVNNFGDNSFYINLNEDISDNYIRLVIYNEGIVFGLKIKKIKYDIIKEKLKMLKK